MAASIRVCYALRITLGGELFLCFFFGGAPLLMSVCAGSQIFSVYHSANWRVQLGLWDFWESAAYTVTVSDGSCQHLALVLLSLCATYIIYCSKGWFRMWLSWSYHEELVLFVWMFFLRSTTPPSHSRRSTSDVPSAKPTISSLFPEKPSTTTDPSHSMATDPARQFLQQV